MCVGTCVNSVERYSIIHHVTIDIQLISTHLDAHLGLEPAVPRQCIYRTKYGMHVFVLWGEIRATGANRTHCRTRTTHGATMWSIGTGSLSGSGPPDQQTPVEQAKVAESKKKS